jgi:hypothetical protein
VLIDERVNWRVQLGDALIHLVTDGGTVSRVLCGSRQVAASSYTGDWKQCEKCWELLRDIRRRESTR